MTRTQLLQSLVLLLVLLIVGTGCGKRSADEFANAPPAAAASGPLSAKRDRAVVVETSITVNEVEASTTRIREATEQAGGYVANANLSGNDEARSSRLEVRVPAAALRAFLATVASTGEVVTFSERADDVTNQRADVKARLGNARAQEKRILELMATKTSTLGETIEAEKELARVRETVEQLDAQERTVDSSVAFATVHVSLQLRSVDSWRTPGKSISRAASSGMRGAAAFFVFVVMAIATVAPTLLPIGLVVAAIVFFLRKRADRKRLALEAQLGR